MGEVKHECEHGQLARVCNICGYESDIADLTAERDALRAEVAKVKAHATVSLNEWSDAMEEASATIAKLSAAAAQMREALKEAVLNDGGTSYTDSDDDAGSHACCHEVSYREHDADCWVPQCRAALATDAGRNWIDASGAIEAEVGTCDWDGRGYESAIVVIGDIDKRSPAFDQVASDLVDKTVLIVKVGP